MKLGYKHILAHPFWSITPLSSCYVIQYELLTASLNKCKIQKCTYISHVLSALASKISTKILYAFLNSPHVHYTSFFSTPLFYIFFLSFFFFNEIFESSRTRIWQQCDNEFAIHPETPPQGKKQLPLSLKNNFNTPIVKASHSNPLNYTHLTFSQANNTSG